MHEVIAAHAAREAFSAARAAASHEIAIEVALARYRAFFPLAQRQDVHDVLVGPVVFATVRIASRRTLRDAISG
jgi:hypothetical protein